MKKTLLLIATVLCCAMTIFAQNNNQISYQAVVRDAENKLVANKNVTVLVNIYDGDIQDPVYTKTYTNVQTNLNGLISLLIGPAATEPSDAWMQIHWNHARIETTVTLDGTELGLLAMPLTAVPYALYAAQAAELDPNATVIRDIYEKMTSDSTDIYHTIQVDSTVLAAKMRADSSALADRMRADSSVLANKMRADSSALVERMHADSSALANKMRADSAALANHLNDTLSEYVKKTELCGFVKECVAPDFNAVYNKIEADSSALANKMHADSLAMAKHVHDTLTTLMGVLAQQRENLITLMDSKINSLTARIDSLSHVTDSLANVTANMPKMAQDSFTVVVAGKTEFLLKNVPDNQHILRMYINGVMVGGDHSGVLTIANAQNKTVTYHADKNTNHNNESYTLKAGDKVTIVYWYLPTPTTATATTSGY